MTPEQIGTFEKIFIHITEGDRPFMGLFLIIMCFMIYMALKAMNYVKGLSDGHKEELTTMTVNHNEQLTFMRENLAEQRREHYQQLAEDRMRSDRREDGLFANMDKNTEQLTDIASTLKDVQFNLANLEKQVTENFDFLSSEIESVKTKVTIKTETIRTQG